MGTFVIFYIVNLVGQNRPELKEPAATTNLYSSASATTVTTKPGAASALTAHALIAPAQSALAPSTIANSDGLDFATFGGGYPPNANGDVGPTYYIQAIDGSIGIFRKSDGVRVAALSLNTFMSQGNFGNWHRLR